MKEEKDVVDENIKKLKELEERIKKKIEDKRLTAENIPIKYEFNPKTIITKPLKIEIDLSNVKNYWYFLGMLEGMQLVEKMIEEEREKLSRGRDENE